jgi:hypothetical protein
VIGARWDDKDNCQTKAKVCCTRDERMAVKEDGETNDNKEGYADNMRWFGGGLNKHASLGGWGRCGRLKIAFLLCYFTRYDVSRVHVTKN